MSAMEFIEGQEACRKGESCPTKAGTDFVRGYQFEYFLQENRTAQQIRQERKNVNIR